MVKMHSFGSPLAALRRAINTIQVMMIASHLPFPGQTLRKSWVISRATWMRMLCSQDRLFVQFVVYSPCAAVMFTALPGRSRTIWMIWLRFTAMLRIVWRCGSKPKALWINVQLVTSLHRRDSLTMGMLSQSWSRSTSRILKGKVHIIKGILTSLILISHQATKIHNQSGYTFGRQKAIPW